MIKKAFRIGFALFFLTLFLSNMVVYAKGPDALMIPLKRSQLDAKNIFKRLGNIHKVDYILAPYNEFVFTGEKAQIQRYLPSFEKNILEIDAYIPDKQKPSIELFAPFHESSQAFLVMTQDMIAILQQAQEFQNTFQKQFETLHTAIRTKFLDLGYKQSTLAKKFQSIDQKKSDKHILTSHLQNTIDLHKKEFDLQPFLQKLENTDVLPANKAFKSRLTHEFETLKNMFEHLQQELYEGKSDLFLTFMNNRMAQRDFHRIIRDLRLPTADKSIQKEALAAHEKSYQNYYKAAKAFASFADSYIQEVEPQENIGLTPENTTNEPHTSSKQTLDNASPDNDRTIIVKERGTNIWDVMKIAIPVLTVVGGYLITRRKRGKFSKYLKQVDYVYSEHKLKTTLLEEELNRLKEIITVDLQKGKIDEAAYSIIEKRIEQYLAKAKKQEMRESED